MSESETVDDIKVAPVLERIAGLVNLHTRVVVALEAAVDAVKALPEDADEVARERAAVAALTAGAGPSRAPADEIRQLLSRATTAGLALTDHGVATYAAGIIRRAAAFLDTQSFGKPEGSDVAGG